MNHLIYAYIDKVYSGQSVVVWYGQKVMLQYVDSNPYFTVTIYKIVKWMREFTQNMRLDPDKTSFKIYTPERGWIAFLHDNGDDEGVQDILVECRKLPSDMELVYIPYTVVNHIQEKI